MLRTEISYFGQGITKGMGKEAVLHTDVGRNNTSSCFKAALGKVTPETSIVSAQEKTNYNDLFKSHLSVSD